MTLRKLFPYALVACSTLGFSITGVAQVAQKAESRIGNQLPVQVAALENDVAPVNREDVVVISEASADDVRLARIPTSNSTAKLGVEQLLFSAIDDRLGARYRWGATGPSAFDCSGFVWSIYHSAGIDFERSSARTLWVRFEAPSEDEKYKFGTLVFFSNLAHVGVVADEKGFYHASRHHGVIYSPFNEYWLKRLDGFRKVPPAQASAPVE